jgi:hypothetical protein
MSASAYQPDTRVRPSAWWYVAVAVLWIASFVVFVIAIKPIISIFSAGVDEVRNNSAISIPADGRTVYSSIRPATVNCTLTGSDNAPVRMKPFDAEASDSFTFSFDDGTDVHPLASTPDDLPAGQYELSCQVPARATLATGERLDFDSFAVRLIVGVIVSIAAGLAGLVILIVLLVRRHRSKQRIRQAQATAAYGYGGYAGYGYESGGYPGYPGYPPGGYQQGGYPAPESPPADQPDAPAGDASPYGEPPPPPPPPPGQGGSPDDGGQPPPDRR